MINKEGISLVFLSQSLSYSKNIFFNIFRHFLSKPLLQKMPPKTWILFPSYVSHSYMCHEIMIMKRCLTSGKSSTFFNQVPKS